MTTALSGTLRIVMSLAVVGTAGFAGFILRSPWIILPMTIAFTLLYVAGKWEMWKSAYLVHGLPKTIGNFLITIPIQMIVCGVCYLVGYGLGSLVGARAAAGSLETFDWYLVAGLCAVALPATAIITWLERGPAEMEPESPFGLSSYLAEEPELVISSEPVTVDTSFQGVHFSHYDYERADPDHVPNEAVTKPGQIDEAEKRLGIILPPLLRQLYERQNGGGTGALFLAAKDDPGSTYDDWRMPFSHDYDELKPLDQLRTYYDHFLDWGDPDDPDDIENLPPNAKQMIVLSMHCADTTYLDYSKPGGPSVGVVDFDPHTSETNLYFESFEALFAQLRREVDD